MNVDPQIESAVTACPRAPARLALTAALGACLLAFALAGIAGQHPRAAPAQRASPAVRELLKKAAGEAPGGAIATLKRAERLAIARNDRPGRAAVAAAEMKLGTDLLDRGDVARAQPLLESALRIQERDAGLALPRAATLHQIA